MADDEGRNGSLVAKIASTATIILSIIMVVALAFVVYQFEASRATQREQAAVQVLQDHYRLILDNADVSEVIRTHREHSESLTPEQQQRILRLSSHGLLTGSVIHEQMAGDPSWEGSVRSLIKIYSTYVKDTFPTSGCGLYEKDFLDFVESTLEEPDLCSNTAA